MNFEILTHNIIIIWKNHNRIKMSFAMLRETLTNAARYLVQDIVAGVDRDATSSESESEEDLAQRAEGERLNAKLFRGDDADQVGNDMAFEGEEEKNEDHHVLDARRRRERRKLEAKI